MEAAEVIESSRANPVTGPPIRLLALLEARRVTGVAKTLTQFYRFAAAPGIRNGELPRVVPCVVSFKRSRDDRVINESETALEGLLQAVGARREIIAERFPFDAGVAAQLGRVAQKFGPDIIESHSVKSHAVVFYSGLWRQLPWIAYHHGYTAPDAKMRLYNLADCLTLRMADRVVTVAEAFASVLLGRGVSRERLSILHNAVETESATERGMPRNRSEVGKALSLSDSTSIVLSVSRLSAEKGVADLIRSFAVLARNRRTLALVIAGDGPDRKRLEDLSRALGIAAQTRFTGHVVDPSPYYAIADVLAIASHSEGSSHTLLEALSAGVPVVATMVGGTPEIVIDNVNGLLTAPREPHAMANAIERILADRRLASRLITAGKKTVAERFTPAIRAERLIRILRDVLQIRTQQRERKR